MTKLETLYICHNELTGPIPDLSALTQLEFLELEGNGFCLPAGASPSHENNEETAHLMSLNLPACTETDLAAVLAAPPNLTATVTGNQVTLS